MKNLKAYSLCFVAALLIISCSNDDTKIIYKGGTSPVLSASTSSNVVLNKADENLSSLQFQWTNPSYSFSNGVSTQDVYYTLQIDTTDTFSNPKIATVSFTNDVFHSFTVKELNTLLSGLELKDYVVHNFKFRIKATLASNNEPQYSNVVAINISTYLDVKYPVPANLYIVGSATAAQWNNDVAHLVPSQQFAKVNSYTFQLNSLAITADEFLFVPVAGDWSHKYAFDADAATNNTAGDYFAPDVKSNFKAPAAGNYKITVNFKTGKYSMEKL